MDGKKLMINWELKKVLPYATKRYCLIFCNLLYHYFIFLA